MNLLEGVGTTSLDLSTVFAVPDPNSLPLHTKLQTCQTILISNIRDKSATLESWHSGTLTSALLAAKLSNQPLSYIHQFSN
jgi:hypothetical protein